MTIELRDLFLLVLTILLAIVGWLSRAYLTEIKADVKQLLSSHSSHAERITALETSIEDLKKTPYPWRRKK